MATGLVVLLAILLGAPGLRLLASAARQRGGPELWAGLFFLGIGVGLPLRLLGVNADDAAQADLLNSIGHAFFASGACFLYVFIRVVFRPDAVWATRAAWLGSLAILATTLLVFATGNASNEQALPILSTNLARTAPILWAFVESLRYWRLMRRRRELGLADAIVTNRFLLWALWTGALGFMPAAVATLRLTAHVVFAAGVVIDPQAAIQQILPLIRLAFVIAAPVAVVSLWLSFYPPQGYVERLRASAAI